jgi:hypothetical protein
MTQFSLLPASADSFLNLLLHPEDGGRRVELFINYVDGITTYSLYPS